MKKGFLKLVSAIATATLLVAACVMPKAVLAGVNVGAEDLSTGWWGAHTEIYKVEEGKDVTFTFINHSKAEQFYQSAVVVLQNTATGHGAADVEGYKEYAVCRVDNWGWGEYYNTATLENNFNWDTMKTDMDGATFTVKISRKGNKTDIAYDIKTKDGKSYFQTYKGITFEGDLYTCLTVDACWLENVTVQVGDPEPVAPATGIPFVVLPVALIMVASGAMAIRTLKNNEEN